MHEVSIADAKNHLTQVVRDAENGETVHITRRGKRAAVLLSEAEYQRLKRQQPEADLWSTISDWRATASFEEDGLSGDEVDGWRDRGEGREFSWEE